MTPNSTKSLLKRLRESHNDEEGNKNMLNEILQKAKNAQRKQEQDNGDVNEKHKEEGEVSDRELSDGEIDSQVGS